MVTYSQEFIRIENINPNLSINSKFKNTTIYDYFNKYRNLSNVKQDEKAIVEFNGDVYLPQFLIVCADSDMQSDNTKKVMRDDYSNLDPRDVIKESLCRNKALDDVASKITSKILKVNIKRAEDIDETKDNANDVLWDGCAAHTVRAYKLNEPYFINELADFFIIYDIKYKEEVKGIKNKFKDVKLKEPKLKSIDMKKLDRIRDILTDSSSFGVALFVIENEECGDRIKKEISQFSNLDTKFKIMFQTMTGNNDNDNNNGDNGNNGNDDNEEEDFDIDYVNNGNDNNGNDDNEEEDFHIDYVHNGVFEGMMHYFISFV